MHPIKCLLLMMLFSCNNNNSQGLVGTGDSSLAVDIDTTGLMTGSGEQANDTLINVRFPPAGYSTKVEGKMKGANHRITVNIPVKQGELLTVLLQPADSIANVRISQIFTPDGKADGPFGRDLKYAIKQQGNYKLVIGENLMQGEEWKGKFWLTVTVK